MAGPMLCPTDQTPLVMSERQNIEIDYCPTCRGVWLDRGELDKIIERSGAGSAAQAAPERPRANEGGVPRGYSHDDGQRYGKRKKSFFEEIFD
jgi:Zn-finger nucleic acid-binding protein